MLVCKVTKPFPSAITFSTSTGWMVGVMMMVIPYWVLVKDFSNTVPLFASTGAAPLLIDISSTMEIVAGVLFTVMTEGAALS